ncbi:hypothetical protein JQ561_30800 [Bradyrhizobium diazoefficiens]|nr:hypothetical protein [Bradyrhizobium diazoefficiens]MBR0931022.1 hypothetical protein [Bradyrhizobium diazoefficiens]
MDVVLAPPSLGCGDLDHRGQANFAGSSIALEETTNRMDELAVYVTGN